MKNMVLKIDMIEKRILGTATVKDIKQYGLIEASRRKAQED